MLFNFPVLSVRFDHSECQQWTTIKGRGQGAGALHQVGGGAQDLIGGTAQGPGLGEATLDLGGIAIGPGHV